MCKMISFRKYIVGQSRVLDTHSSLTASYFSKTTHKSPENMEVEK